MNAPLSIANRRASRKAFTLVELLVVIVIIGILTAILIPTIGGLIRTTEEFGITNETQQLDAAIENFKTEFGFYPPDFSEFRDPGTGVALPYAAVESRLLQFLAKISPTHQELSLDPVHGGSGETRLEHWWEEVGVNLVENPAGLNKEERLRGPRVALWFWLTQLYNNAQFPLTGPRVDNDPSGNLVDRQTVLASAENKVFYDFDGRQLNQLAGVPDYHSKQGPAEYAIYEVLQANGFDTPILYIHHETYLTAVVDFIIGNPSGFPDYTDPYDQTATYSMGMACETALNSDVYYNAESYQIITAGYDELFGILDQGPPTVPIPFENRDNICNFAEGRLDTFVPGYTN